MNTQQIQIKRQRLVFLSLASLILIASLAWVEADASRSIVQPAQITKDCVNPLQPGYPEPSAQAGCPRTGFSGGEGELPWPFLRSIKARKGGGNAGEF